MSATPPGTDILGSTGYVRKVPNPAIAVLFVGTSEDRRRNDEGECLALPLNDDLGIGVRRR